MSHQITAQLCGVVERVEKIAAAHLKNIHTSMEA